MPARTRPNCDTPRIEPLDAGVLTLPATGTMILLDSADWRAWLREATHFYVVHPRGGFSCRKDGRARGTSYWSAFRRYRGRTYRAYLGKDDTITAVRLRQVGDELAEQARGALAGGPLAPQPSGGIEPGVAVMGVRADDAMLWLTLADGRVVGAPLTWFPRLQRATPEQRAVWEVSGDGSAVHWPELDEDISARVLMGHPS